MGGGQLARRRFVQPVEAGTIPVPGDGWRERRWVQVLAGGLLIALLGSGMARAQQRKLRLRMERLEMQQALENERHRIARDLHDELGARLTATALQGELALQNGKMPDKAK